MIPQRFVIDRRMVLRGLATATLVPTLPAVSHAASGADAIILTMSDLHSPYARLPAVLKAVRDLRQNTGGTPMAMVLNGDLFERGNVVATRSGASADWVFLKALAAELPVFINLGNHETAILDDMAVFTAMATQAGAQVISNLMDKRTGRFFAPVSDRIGLGGIDIAMLGIATTNPFVYRKPARDTLGFLNPESFVKDVFADATAGADLPMLVTHAGVTPDKALLPHLPAGALVHGAHDHLNFTTDETGQHYIHGGAWATQLGVVSLQKNGQALSVTSENLAIAPADGDPEIAEAIASAKAQHLTESDTAVIVELGAARNMHQSILLATEAVQQATEADVAVLGHTTFGAPLAAGPLSKYNFDAFIRFDGGLSMAEIPGERLAQILTRANQFAATDLAGRTGDYVHVADVQIDPGKTYRFVTNGWTAFNQKSYLGTEDLEFVEVPDLALKAVVIDYLAAL